MSITHLEPAGKPVPPVPRAAVRPLAAGLLVAAGLYGAWSGGAAGLGGTVLLLAAAWVLRPATNRPSAPARSDEPVAGAGSTAPADRHAARGAPVMVGAIVPVWSRQLEVTRDSSAESLAALLNDFAEISGSLDTLSRTLDSVTLSAEPGAVDGAVRSQAPALAALCSASARAYAERDRIADELARVGDGLRELRQLAKQARELGRHTRLVALNASIESNRNPGTSAGSTRREGGTQAVATEIRDLASRVAETAERIESLVDRMSAHTAPVLRDSAVGGSSDDELRIEIDLRAREALAALIGGLGAALHGSGEARQAASALRDRIDSSFVHFQFGDRVSQQLSIVANDMQNFTRWVAENPSATQGDAAAWLAALEQSYTMEEQRSNHHGTVHVERSTGVEFF